MKKDRFFLDTVFIQAILNYRDQYHSIAQEWMPRVKTAQEVWVTEAIFLEVGNALSTYRNSQVTHFIRQCYETPNIEVVNITPELFNQGLALYQDREDKAWGLVDCISFVVMKEQNLYDALTCDRNFIQAGLNALLR